MRLRDDCHRPCADACLRVQRSPSLPRTLTDQLRIAYREVYGRRSHLYILGTEQLVVVTVLGGISGKVLAAKLGAGYNGGLAVVYWMIFAAVATFGTHWFVRRFCLHPELLRNAVALCLIHQRCPSCLYDLSNIAMDQQGVTQCPECGACWNASLPRLARFKPKPSG